MALLSFILASLLAVSPNINLEKALSDVDRAISKSQDFRAQKQERIDGLKQNLRKDNEFSIYNQLFLEYRFYQFDSAYVYARKMEAMAAKSNINSEKATAQTALLFCFKSVGYFNEATDVIKQFNPAGLSRHYLRDFYLLCAQTYLNMSAFVGGTEDLGREYDTLKNRYYNLAKDNADPHTFEFDGIDLELKISHHYSDSLAIIGRKNYISQYQYSIDEHELGVQYSILAMAYDALNFTTEAIYYRALSTLYDIRSCTHETTSAKVLAEYMNTANDLTRAHNYINQALYDAQFYNSRIRMVEINTILSQIENRRYDWANRQRVLYLAFGSIVLVLLILTFFLLFRLGSINKKLVKTHEQLLDSSNKLKISNESLSRLNEKLLEVNDIKDCYIIESLNDNPNFVNYVEKEIKTTIAKLGAKQYDDARTRLFQLDLKRERERIYSSFDTAFLKLFPNFLSEFNALFPPEEGIKLDENGALPVNVRVFALMRLGIDKPAQVAEYLNLSVNTVYVYKANLKAKSIYKDDFEERILAIPKP